MSISKVIGVASNLPIVNTGLSVLTKKAEIVGTLRGFKTGALVGAVGALVLASGACAAVIIVHERNRSTECCDDHIER